MSVKKVLLVCIDKEIILAITTEND